MALDEEVHRKEQHIWEVTHPVTPAEYPKHSEITNKDGLSIAKRKNTQSKNCRILDWTVEVSLPVFPRKRTALEKQKTDCLNKKRKGNEYMDVSERLE
jgi:hypothetical protein